MPVYNRFVTGCLTALEYPYPAASRAASASAREAAQYRHLLRGETKRDVASGMTLWQLRVLCRVLDLTLDDSLLKRVRAAFRPAQAGVHCAPMALAANAAAARHPRIPTCCSGLTGLLSTSASGLALSGRAMVVPHLLHPGQLLLTGALQTTY